MVRETKRQRGDGITERTILHRSAETATEAVAALDEMDRQLAEPLAGLRLEIERARRTYAGWRALNPDVPQGHETLPDMLLQVTLLGKEMERAIAEGDAERSAGFASGVGKWLALLYFKHNWEPEALRGQKVGKGLAEAAEKTARLHRPLRERRLERMRELVAEGHKVEKAARYCEAEGLGNWQAVRRQWNRWKEKPDT